MRILHVADGDPRQPGVGGSAVRTTEISRRLAGRHEITVLVPSYPGARERVEDGVRWVPIGPMSGGRLGRMAYIAWAGTEVLRRSHDLLVEDFSAPFSVAFSPLYTRRPAVAVVHWLFASELGAKYHLPFGVVEGLGLRLYRNFIAVSEWLAGELRGRRPGSVVEAIPNAVEKLAFEVEPSPPRHLLFLGRLDIVHKGLDYLLEIAARARFALGAAMPPLLLVGDGPDRARLEALVAERNLSDVVEFRGRVERREKYELIASSYAVLLSSRFETFSIVAAESLAAGAPLVAFDIGPLREVAGGGGAVLVRPFDTRSFADEIVRLVREPEVARQLREQGRRWAGRYSSWDDVAARQEEFYFKVARGDLPSRDRQDREAA